MNEHKINYFLGCNSPSGFVSFFDTLFPYDGQWHCFVLKGGPGTGKSTVMKKTASELERIGYRVNYIHCSSDPQSLDGIICEELKTVMADGTAPHVIEPLYPGAAEITVDLGIYRNDEALQKKAEDIIRLTREVSHCHRGCIRFLDAAFRVINDSRFLCEDAFREYKLRSYTDRFSARRFKKKNTIPGKEKRILLSAVTPEGVVFYGDTVKALAGEIIKFEDQTGLASGMIMENLRTSALRNGYDVISCYCPLEPYGQPEHLIIPELSLALITGHSEYGFEDYTRTVHCKRFFDCDCLGKRKNRLAFNKRVREEMINAAVSYMEEARNTHGKLEKIYIESMDFSGYEALIKKLVLKFTENEINPLT